MQSGSYEALTRRGIRCLFLEEKILHPFLLFFFLFFWHFLVAFSLLFKDIVLVSVTVFHRRLARLVVGPFWAWNCTGGGPSVHVMRLCSGRLHASMWSCRSCWEKFWCICAASWASMAFPQALFRSGRQEQRVLTSKHPLPRGLCAEEPLPSN